MKSTETLQGLIITSGHLITHLSLLLAEPITFAWFSESFCGSHERKLAASTGMASKAEYNVENQPFNENNRLIFMAVHLLCLVSLGFSKFFSYLVSQETVKLAEFVTLPIYIWMIFYGQYYYLNTLSHGEGFDVRCGDGEFDLIQVWFHIEINVFYAQVFATALFLSIA